MSQIVETGADRVRAVDAGAITTIAGGSTDPFGFAGNGGPAISASFVPNGIAIDAAGAICIADASAQTASSSRSSASPHSSHRRWHAVVGRHVDAPGQLAVDDHGNLYVTSRSTVGLVTNADDDDQGDDAVFTIYGAGDRGQYPESSSSCLTALTVTEVEDVIVADVCAGFAVRLSRQLD